MERRRITYAGRVQGVGFRATAQATASGLSISGWVRNQADETVLLEVQGEPPEIDRFLHLLRTRMGRLIHAETPQQVSPIEGEAGFDIRR